jgi:hypothetical protein
MDRPDLRNYSASPRPYRECKSSQLTSSPANQLLAKLILCTLKCAGTPPVLTVSKHRTPATILLFPADAVPHKIMAVDLGGVDLNVIARVER